LDEHPIKILKLEREIKSLKENISKQENESSSKDQPDDVIELDGEIDSLKKFLS